MTGIALHERGETQIGSEVEFSFRRRISLDGPWRFRTDASAAWRIIQVPGCWESQFADLRGWAGTAVYERGFRLPEGFLGNRVVLHFDAVDYYTEVWVNDCLAGRHEGGYLPFSFDVTDIVARNSNDDENVLTVRVTDATPDEDVPLPDSAGTLSFAEIPHGKQSWYTPVSGIWQSVWLESRSDPAIDSITFNTDLDTGGVRVHFRLMNQHAGCIQLRVFSPDGRLAHEEQRDLPCGDWRFRISELQAWSPESPNLYRAEAILQVDGMSVDRVDSKFGFRKIETRDGHIWLNNEPYFIIGALDQAFYPRTIYTAPSRDYLRDQFVKAKEMGLNLIRCHIKVPSTDYLDLCDELGLLVWYEIPNGALLTQALRSRLKETFEGMLQRDANHPSIVIMSVMNESWGIELSNTEQREWLFETFHWAKEAAPDRLIVDNSACIPNFHVVSDLDDYHVYYSIPDQAQEFHDWVQSFADRDAGSYSGFGDASRHHKEPLLVSEFGNWGLPRLDAIEESEGGTPWWYETGEGITRPHGSLQRFQQQKLGRVFNDWNALADSSQEQQWIALKYQIEEMRRRREVSGYVITEFTDLNWEANGLLDFARNPKTFYNRLPALQQQDLLIPRPERYAYWSCEEIAVSLQLSRFSGRSTEGGRIFWRILGVEGSLPADAVTSRSETTNLATILLQAPHAPEPTKTQFEVWLSDESGSVIASNYSELAIVPDAMRAIGNSRRVWFHDPLGAAPDGVTLLEASGFAVVNNPEGEALAIATQWTPEVNRWLQDGGNALLFALHPKSLQIASGLNLRLVDRQMHNWWGDWCSHHTWFLPGVFPHLPDTQKLGFEYMDVIPKLAISGASPDNVLSGIFVGWLRNPGAYVVKLPVGKGTLIVSTFDLLTHLATDPISTLMLADLAALSS